MRTAKASESQLETTKETEQRPFGFDLNGDELKAKRRKPSVVKHCDIEDIPSLTGVLAHFRLHLFNAVRT
jgi:hypothetical protein